MSMLATFCVIGINDMEYFLNSLPDEIGVCEKHYYEDNSGNYYATIYLKNNESSWLNVYSDDPNIFEVTYYAGGNSPKDLIQYLQNKFNLYVFEEWCEYDVVDGIYDIDFPTLDNLANDLESFSNLDCYYNDIIRLAAKHQHKMGISFEQGSDLLFYDYYLQKAYEYFTNVIVPKFKPCGEAYLIINAPPLTDSQITEYVINKQIHRGSHISFDDERSYYIRDKVYECTSIEEWVSEQSEVINQLQPVSNISQI